MKRVLLSIIGTVAGLVALLSFKTHGQGAVSAATLPSAGVPSSSAPVSGSTQPGTAQSGTAASAPPDPSATPPASSTSSASSFIGAAENTRYGVVQVKVTVAAGKITNVAFVQLTANDGRSQRIDADAAPILLQETLTAQSAQIDSVSGASYTSQGYQESLQSALDQAGIK